MNEYFTYRAQPDFCKDQVSLNDRCWTVENGVLIEHKIKDFMKYVDTACRPNGIDYKYYLKELGDAKWGVMKWENGEKTLRVYATENEASDHLNGIYITCILYDSPILIHLDRERAEHQAKEYYGNL